MAPPRKKSSPARQRASVAPSLRASASPRRASASSLRASASPLRAASSLLKNPSIFKRLPTNVFMFTNAKSPCYGDRVIIANMTLKYTIFMSNLLGKLVHGLPLTAADTLAGISASKLKKTSVLCKKMTGMPFDLMVTECGKRIYGLMIVYARRLTVLAGGPAEIVPLHYGHRQLIQAALAAAAQRPVRRQLMCDVDVVFACTVIPAANPPHYQLFGEPLPSCGLRGYEFLFYMRQMCLYWKMDMVRFIRAMGKAEVAMIKSGGPRDSSKKRRAGTCTPVLLEIKNGKDIEFLVFLFTQNRAVICHFGHKELPNKSKYTSFAAEVLGANKGGSAIKDVEFAQYIVSPPAIPEKKKVPPRGGGGMHRVDMQLGCYVFRRVYYNINDHQKVLAIMRDKRLLCPHTKTSEIRKMMNLQSLISPPSRTA